MFKNVDYEDHVWSPIYGWGIVVDLSDFESDKFPIGVEFTDHPTCVHFYTTDGKADIDDAAPTLFWRKFVAPKEATEKNYREVPVDTLVKVWDDNENSFLRHFSHFSNGRIHCYIDGRTSKTIMSSEVFCYEKSLTKSWKHYQIMMEEGQ